MQHPLTREVLALANRRGFTDAELATALNMDRSQLWRLKRGRSQPSLRFLIAAKLLFPELNAHAHIAPDSPQTNSPKANAEDTNETKGG